MRNEFEVEVKLEAGKHKAIILIVLSGDDEDLD